MNQIKQMIRILIGFLFLGLGAAVVLPKWDFFPFRLTVEVISLLDFGIHEMGHMVFSLFQNKFLTVAGGSFFHWGAPLLMTAYSLYK